MLKSVSIKKIIERNVLNETEQRAHRTVFGSAAFSGEYSTGIGGRKSAVFNRGVGRFFRF